MLQGKSLSAPFLSQSRMRRIVSASTTTLRPITQLIVSHTKPSIRRYGTRPTILKNYVTCSTWLTLNSYKRLCKNDDTKRYFSTYTEDDRNRITAVATETQTPISLQTLLRTGRGDFLHKSFAESTVEKHAATELVLRQVASFLRRELPVRMARRVADLESVPVLRDMSSVLQVKDAYIQSCMDIMNYTRDIDSPTTEEEFSRLIEAIYERHGSVLVQMARGAYEFRQAIRRDKGATDIELEEETHEFLDRFYLCRIGIRVLIGQYLALRQPPVSNYIGIICSHTSPYEIVKRAIDDAAFMCTRKYGDAPEVIITGRLDLTFPYVPTHLREWYSIYVYYCLIGIL
jgi:Mitochondrial branched-chain alpha-ketoacid dehydrogenase kinase